MGSLIGLASGYFGGRFDAFVMRTADGMMSFPLVLAALLLVAVIGPGVSDGRDRDIAYSLGALCAADPQRGA